MNREGNRVFVLNGPGLQTAISTSYSTERVHWGERVGDLVDYFLDMHGRPICSVQSVSFRSRSRRSRCIPSGVGHPADGIAIV